jgi:hypothetical protein
MLIFHTSTVLCTSSHTYQSLGHNICPYVCKPPSSPNLSLDTGPNTLLAAWPLVTKHTAVPAALSLHRSLDDLSAGTCIGHQNSALLVSHSRSCVQMDHGQYGCTNCPEQTSHLNFESSHTHSCGISIQQLHLMILPRHSAGCLASSCAACIEKMRWCTCHEHLEKNCLSRTIELL